MSKKTTHFVALLFVSLFAAIPVLGAPEIREFNFTGFTGVSVGSGMNVEITQGQNYRVSVRAEPAELERLRVEKRGDALQFSMGLSGSWRRQGRVDITITMPRLTDLSVSGGAQATVTMDIASDRFRADVSGGGGLKGHLRAGDVDLNLSGGSEVTLEGNGGDISVDGSGGAELHARDFAVRNVRANLSGGSEMTVTMEGELEGHLSGGSEIVYYGNASLGRTDFSGGSSIRRGR
jgi:hypothetical protein